MDKRYLLHGALPAFGAACCFSLMLALIKLASGQADSFTLVFLRSFFGLLVVTPFVFARGRRFLHTTRSRLHLLRAVVSFAAMSCFYFAISHIGLGEAILLNSSSPLFIGVLAIFMLGERLNGTALFALLLGFAGVLLLLKPGTELFQLGAMVGACSGLFVAFAKIFIRQMANTEPVLRTVFYFGLYSSLISLVPLLVNPTMPSTRVLVIMALASVFATLGQTALTYAFSHNRAASVAPFSYVTVVGGGLIGWWVWNEIPDQWSLAGGVLVMCGCLIMVLRPTKADPWREPKPASNAAS